MEETPRLTAGDSANRLHKLRLPHTSFKSDRGKLCCIQEHQPFRFKQNTWLSKRGKEKQTRLPDFKSAFMNIWGCLPHLKASHTLYLGDTLARKTLLRQRVNLLLVHFRGLTCLIKINPLGSAALVEKVEDVRVTRQKAGEGSSHADSNASADRLHRVHRSKAEERTQQQDVLSPGFHLFQTLPITSFNLTQPWL